MPGTGMLSTQGSAPAHGSSPSPSGENPNNWTHMQHWAEYKLTLPLAPPYSVFSSALLPLHRLLISHFLHLISSDWAKLEMELSGGQLDSKSLCLCATRIHHLLFCFLWVITRVNSYAGLDVKIQPHQMQTFPVHFPSPYSIGLIHCYPSPPSPGLTKADSSNCPSGIKSVYSFLNLTQNYYFWQLNFFSMLDTNILISCYLSWGEIKFYTRHSQWQGNMFSGDWFKGTVIGKWLMS